MNSSRTVAAVGRICTRQISQSAVRNEKVIEVVHPRFKQIKELQKRFQIDDGVPVHLKNGAKDRALYGVSVFLTAATTVYSFYSLYRIIYKK